MKQRVPNKFQEECLDKAIGYIKKKGFGFIKFELEAQLNRTSIVRCGRCKSRCTNCDGMGTLVIDNALAKCSDCKYGVVECKDKHYSFGDTNVCKNFILENIPKASRDHIVFSKYYLDGSVDSEYTVTVRIEHVRDMVHIINAFLKIAELNGKGIDTRGAGMHIALLNDPSGFYSNTNHHANRLERVELANMTNALNALMPALFFLASADHRSRPMRYRSPVMRGSKYSAINTAHNVLEYRVFETCYMNPYRLYEFVEVIAKTLTFYDRVPAKIKGVGKVEWERPGQIVRRLFDTKESLRALEATLPYLMPNSRTVAAIKRNRGYNLDEKRIELLAKIRVNRIVGEWGEYMERLALARRAGQNVTNYPQDLKTYIKVRLAQIS